MTILHYPYTASANQSFRKVDEVSATVFHYTGGGSADGSISWLCDPASKVSARFVISRSGDITQLPLDRAAWHAGISEVPVGGEMLSDANKRTFGVELANHGYLVRSNGDYYYELGRALRRYRRVQPQFARLQYDNGVIVEGWWEPYPDEQINALQELLRKLKAAGYQRASQHLIGHEEIAMPFGRKKDPGPLFPWERFYRKVDMRTRRTV